MRQDRFSPKQTRDRAVRNCRKTHKALLRRIEQGDFMARVNAMQLISLCLHKIREHTREIEMVLGPTAGHGQTTLDEMLKLRNEVQDVLILATVLIKSELPNDEAPAA